MEQYKEGLESPYDLSTYFGRLKHFQSLSNQRNFFYSEEYLAEQRQLLKDFNSGTNTDRTNEELWKAKYFYLGNYHVQTDELLPKIFRTSGYCIVNAPVIFALTFLPPTPVNQIFAQALNQSFNFFYNFTNGNKSNKYDNTQLAFSLSLAILSAITGSLGTLKLIKHLPIKEVTKQILNRFAPFIGVVVANECNLFFSRIQDFSKGITIYDGKSGQPIPEFNSVQAAKIAFLQTAVSRAVIPIPIFVIPNMWLAGLARFKLTPKNAVVATVINTTVGCCSLYLGLTYALAIYPQTVRVNADQLEPYFNDLKDEQGQKIETFTFNKGL